MILEVPTNSCPKARTTTRNMTLIDIYSGTFLWNSLHETITQCKSLTFISQQAKKKLLLFAQLDTS